MGRGHQNPEILLVRRGPGKLFRGKHALCVCVCAAQSCPTLCESMDCSPPVSSAHGMLKARVLEWFAVPFSKGFSLIRDRTLPPELPGKLDFMKKEDDSENRPWRAASKGPHLLVPMPCMMPLP